MLQQKRSGAAVLAVDPWLVVFDLDGTLIDSSLDLCLAVNAAMSHVGAAVLPHPTITSFVGDGAANLIRRALGIVQGDTRQTGWQEASARQALLYFLDFYREHKLDNTHLYSGVLQALSAIRLARPDLPMAVLTNKPVSPARDICDALGLSRYLFTVYGGDSFSTKKPDPLGLQTLMQEASEAWAARGRDKGELIPSGVVMVGDSAVDISTARNAGATSIGCIYGLDPGSLNAVQPDLLAASPRAWPGLLGIRNYADQSQAAPRTPLESP